MRKAGLVTLACLTTLTLVGCVPGLADLSRGSPFAEAASANAGRTSLGRIAVARIYSPATLGIVTMDPQGHRRRPLTRHRGWIDDDPVWRPDGSQIAFTRTMNGYRSFQVFVMRADGSGVRRLTAGRFDERPSWSPSGRWIAYASGGSRGIRIIRADGSRDGRVPGSRDAGDPAWSPNGRRLAFGQRGWIWTSRIDGSDRRRVVRGSEPDWSPDGRRLVYTLPGGGVGKVRLRDRQRSRLGKGLLAAWAPSGRAIAFTRWPPNLDFSVWTMRSDGSHRQRIAVDARNPDWVR